MAQAQYGRAAERYLIFVELDSDVLEPDRRTNHIDLFVVGGAEERFADECPPLDPAVIACLQE